MTQCELLFLKRELICIWKEEEKKKKNQQNNSMEDIQNFIALLFYTYPKKDYEILSAVTQDSND